MALTDVLQGVLNGLSAVLTTSDRPQPGQPVGAKVIPPLGEIDATDIVSGDLDLTWITKDVMYQTSDVEPNLAGGALNTATVAGQPLLGTLGNIISTPGVPGLLGQLKGSLPLPMSGTFPVSASVTWEVLDSDGRTVLPGTEYSAPGGLAGTQISVAFAPDTAELTSSGTLPAPRQRFLRATVSLTAGGVTVGPRALPNVPVLVPAIPIPTVLAFFLHTDFQARSGDDDGAVLIVVPANSPFRTLEQLQPTLTQLQTAIGSLTSFGSFATFLLGLNDLVSAVGAQPYVQFRAEDRINNFNDITLIQRGFFENDTEAEDELSSLILVGAAGKGAQCSNARDCNSGEGQFTVRTTANLFAIVRNLHSASPTVEGGTLTVDTAPPGGWFNPDDFGDDLSSVQFV